jgi:hypothetical protein
VSRRRVFAAAPAGRVVIDDSALSLLASGSRDMSGLVVDAHEDDRYHAYVPALCLAAAASRRPGLADHVGGLFALQILDLKFSDARRVGALVAGGTDWRRAHAIATASPDPEWPEGLPVVTSTPEAYKGHDVDVIPVT